MNNQLEVIVKESGLEQTKANYILEQFKDYFSIADDWERKAKSIVVKNEDQVADMKMAKIGRLELRKKRIDVEKARVNLKQQCLREGKAIDGIANVLKALIIPIEEYLGKQEKFVELKKEAEDNIRRLEIEKRMEEERIAKEEEIAKYEAEEKERIRKENEQLKKEAEDNRIKAEAERKSQEAKEKKEREEHEAEMSKQREDSLKKQEEIKKKAEAERKEAEAESLKEKQKIESQRKKAQDEAERLKEQVRRIIEDGVTCPKCNNKFKIK